MKHVRLTCLCLLVFNIFTVAQNRDDLRRSVNEIQQKLETQKMPTDLQQCQARVKEVEDWARINVPKCDALIRELDAHDDLDAIERIFSLAAGLGFGIGLLWIIGRVLRRIRPLSKERKQLFTLLAVAAWISFAAVMALSDLPNHHPLTELAAAFLFSLPAVVFGSVLFWWIGKNPSTAR